MKKNLLLFLVLITVSCKLDGDAFDNFEFNSLIADSDKLVITLYDSIITKDRARGVEDFPAKKEFKTTNKQEVMDFNKIFENSEKTEYCCCPTSIYAISFFKNNKILDIYYVDTLQFKGKVRIYEGSFQYSYIVDKERWKDYLEKIKK